MRPSAVTRAMLFFLMMASLPGHGGAFQLPPAERLSGKDLEDFSAEIRRLTGLLSEPVDRCSVEFEIARTYAAGHQYQRAIAWLGKTVKLRCGFDARRDKLFDPIRGSSEFRKIVNRSLGMRQISKSREIGSLVAEDTTPENIAYDSRRRVFYLGNTRRSEVVRCASSGQCNTLIRIETEADSSVLGLKLAADGQSLWVTSNDKQGAALYQVDLASDAARRRCTVRGSHLFNDLAISRSGEVFVTDTREGSVYRLLSSEGSCQRFLPEHKFTASNGIALSPDGRLLYVSNFPDGLTTVDLASRSVAALKHDARVSLAYIDGLYALGDNLLAVQNGPMTPRIVELLLTRNGGSVHELRILELNNPSFDGLTTGTLVNGQFYYVANPQLDKPKREPLSPFKVFAIPVASRK